MRRLRDHPYGLSITLAVLFLVSWLLQGIAQATEESWSWATFWNATFENWQSEFLQLLTFVTLTTFLISKGSHESKDSQDRVEGKVDEILANVRAQRRGHIE